MTTTVAQLSDPHIQDPMVAPEALRRFEASPAEIAAADEATHHLIVSGDLTANAQPAEYAAVTAALAAAPCRRTCCRVTTTTVS